MNYYKLFGFGLLILITLEILKYLSDYIFHLEIVFSIVYTFSWIGFGTFASFLFNITITLLPLSVVIYFLVKNLNLSSNKEMLKYSII